MCWALKHTIVLQETPRTPGTLLKAPRAKEEPNNETPALISQGHPNTFNLKKRKGTAATLEVMDENQK